MAHPRKNLSPKEAADKKRFDDIFGHWPAFIAYLSGPEHVYSLLNPFAEKFLGKKDILGKSARKALPEIEGQGFFELLDEVYASGKSCEGKEARVFLDRGRGGMEEEYVDFVFQPIENPEGKREGILIHAVPVTEQVRARKKIEESEKRLQQALEAGEMGTWDYQIATGKLIRSARYDQIFGYEQKVKDWKPQLFWEHVISEDEEMVRQKQAEAKKTGKLDLQVRIRRTDGVIRWIDTQGQYVADETGKPIRMVGTIVDITDRKQVEEEAKKAVNLINLSTDAIITQDVEGKITSWNKGAQDLYGYTAQEVVGKPIGILMPPHKKDEFPKIIEDLRKGRKIDHYETQRLTKDGRIVDVSVTLSPVEDADGHIIGVSKIARDITERKKSEQAILESEERFRTLVQEIEDYAIFRVDPNGRISSWNEGVEIILGYKENEFLGKPVSMIFTAEDQHLHTAEIELEKAAEFGRVEDAREHARKDGTRFQATGVVTAIREAETGKLLGYSKILRDISERIEAEETMRHLSLYDHLTGLPNRKSLEEQLTLALTIAKRNKRMLGVMFVDLDRFKNINDSLGHQIGDMILVEAAKRLKASVREEDIVARLGGDEFIIMLPELHTVQDAIVIAKKIISAMQAPMKAGTATLHISTSLGIALYPNDGDDPSILLKNADTALYRAKEYGRNRFQLYNQAMNVQAAERFKLENELRQAIELGQLRIYYQPIIDLSTLQPVAMEALLRWQHPEWGLMYPNEFIPLAEETDIIFQLGEWVMREACKQNVLWQSKGLPKLKVSVNLSPRQFSSPTLVQKIQSIIEETRMSPEYLDLEITETMAMENVDRTLAKLQELQAMGVDITIDDFGTGYSSLSYLKRFPFRNLKIDRSFVRYCMLNEQDAAIVKTIIAMAKALKIRVIAEGVEGDQQLKFLAGLKCTSVQGHWFTRAIPEDKFADWLRKSMLKGKAIRA